MDSLLHCSFENRLINFMHVFEFELEVKNLSGENNNQHIKHSSCKMKFLLVSGVSLVVSLVSGQSGDNDDWGCNHFSAVPTDFCIGSSSSALKYECNDTYSLMNQIAFDTYDECVFGGDPVSILSFDLDTFDDIECDNEDPCDYFSVQCGDETSIYFPINVCYALSSISVVYQCDGADLIATSYSSDDCSGSSTTVTFDYSDTFTTDDCEVK